MLNFLEAVIVLFDLMEKADKMRSFRIHTRAFEQLPAMQHFDKVRRGRTTKNGTLVQIKHTDKNVEKLNQDITIYRDLIEQAREEIKT